MSLGGGGGGGSAQLQEIASQIEEIQDHKETLNLEINRLESQQDEIDEAIESIESLETGSVVQVPLGGGAYARAEIQDLEEIVVGLGGAYAAERDSAGAISTLEAKQDTLEDRIEEIREEIAKLESESDQLQQHAQQLQTQQLQQMQQQQQQQQQSDE